MTHTSAPSVLPADHPLATPSDLPYGLPDFSAVSDAQLAEAVRANGTECELLVYPDEGHGLAKKTNRLDAYSQALEFLRRHLARG